MTYFFRSNADQSKLQTTIILAQLQALLCAIGAIAIAILHIYRHHLNYTEPTYDPFVVRLIF
ncbi:hypothetical protein Hanom_Chr03g00231841 [Helianthus anomalus]